MPGGGKEAESEVGESCVEMRLEGRLRGRIECAFSVASIESWSVEAVVLEEGEKDEDAPEGESPPLLPSPLFPPSIESLEFESVEDGPPCCCCCAAMCIECAFKSSNSRESRSIANSCSVTVSLIALLFSSNANTVVCNCITSLRRLSSSSSPGIADKRKLSNAPPLGEPLADPVDEIDALASDPVPWLPGQFLKLPELGEYSFRGDLGPESLLIEWAAL